MTVKPGKTTTERQPQFDIRDRMLQVDIGKKLLLIVYLLMLFTLLGCGLAPAALVYKALAPTLEQPLVWTGVVLLCVLVFNYGYIVGLLILRVIIPTPKEGLYPNKPNGRPPIEAILFMINTLLIKLRYNAPFASALPAVLVKLPPFAMIYQRLFGPDTPSTTLGDTCRLLDPYLIKAGKNVQFGFGSTVLAHFYDNRGLMLKGVEVGDNAVIGAESMICPGVKIGHHSLVGVRSVVYPNTVIGPYEFWRGSPAVKVKDLKPGEVIPEEGAEAKAEKEDEG